MSLKNKVSRLGMLGVLMVSAFTISSVQPVTQPNLEVKAQTSPSWVSQINNSTVRLMTHIDNGYVNNKRVQISQYKFIIKSGRVYYNDNSKKLVTVSPKVLTRKGDVGIKNGLFVNNKTKKTITGRVTFKKDKYIEDMDINNGRIVYYKAGKLK